MFLLLLFREERCWLLFLSCLSSVPLRVSDSGLFSFTVIFGEDVAFGGVFRCTVGLRDKYGKNLTEFHKEKKNSSCFDTV